mgnify:FL=1
MRKGQISLFILVGVALLLVIGVLIAFLWMPDENVTEALKVPLELRPLADSIERCIQQQAVDALHLVAYRGGHIVMPEGALQSSEGNFSYGVKEGDNVLPPIVAIETELEQYLPAAIATCFELPSLRDRVQGSDNLSVHIDIRKADVLVQTISDAEITVGQSRHALDDMEILVPLPFEAYHRKVSAFLDQYAAAPEWIDLSFFADSPLNFSINPVDTSTALMTFRAVSQEYPHFAFVAAAELPINSPPEITNLNASYAVEEAMLLELPLAIQDDDGDIVTVTDDTALFDIVNNTIWFSPEIPGHYEVILAVSDGHHHVEYKVNFTVVEN